MDPELQKNLKILIKIGILVLSLLALYLLFVTVLPYIGRILKAIPILFLPFILAIVMAWLVEPVVNMIETKLHFQRGWAVATSLVLMIGGIFSALSLIISAMVREMSGLYRLAIAHSEQIPNRVMESMKGLTVLYQRFNLSPQLESTLQNSLRSVLESIQGILSNSLNSLVQGFAALPGVLIFLMIATVATFFMIRDRMLIKKFVAGFLPGDARFQGMSIINELIKAFTGFLKAYGILISITFLITLVSLQVLGINYALTLALTIGVMDILPVLGPGLVFVPWIIWEFISGHTGLGVSLLVVYTVISVVRQILEPKIVGDSIGLHPLATLISLYVGLQLGGVVGMILGPVTVVIVIACYRAGLLDKYDWRKNHG